MPSSGASKSLYLLSEAYYNISRNCGVKARLNLDKFSCATFKCNNIWISLG